MKKKIRIAILTPGRHKPMGNFSRNYIEYLPFEKIVLFGGFVPFFFKGTSLNSQKLRRYYYTLISFGNQKKIDHYIKNRFKKILIKEKISCVLCEFLNTGAAVREACEELRIPIVSNVLGYEIHKTAILKRNEIQYQKLAQYKSLVVPVAKNMIPKLETLGFKPKQIIYSPLGARMEFFKISPNYRSQQFIAIGRFTESKSPQTTIKAFHQVLKYFPETKLIMAGSGELLEECEELVQNLNIFENVKFVGWINHETQIELLKNSAVFVQHSVTAKNGDAEGTPVAILEASAAGLPIIATRHGGIVDTVVDGETGFLVDENNADEMSNKMIYLLKNPDILEKFGNQGKKFIQENFSMQKHIIEVTNAINTVINS